MDKISRIVPPNGRTRSVDVSRSQPVRPGAPTWGRPEGKVTRTPVDRVNLSSLAAERPLETYKNLSEAKHVKIAKELTDKFFESQYPSPQELRESDTPLSEEMAENVGESLSSNVIPFSSSEEIE
jgi:hypothetical protein